MAQAHYSTTTMVVRSSALWFSLLKRDPRVRGYARALGRSILVALGAGFFLSVLIWSFGYYFQDRHEPSWWASLPYAWTQTLNYLFLPGRIAWSVMLATKHRMVLAVFVGVAVNALVYSALLYFPVLAVKLVLFVTRNSKS
jgi:hypothetical protein